MNILFCGDFACQSPSKVSVESRLVNLFAQQDFVAVNFEAPIRGYGSPIFKSGPSLTQSEDSPAFLEKLGVNIIQMANNHILDQGKEGCLKTMKAFSASVSIIGAGDFEEAYKLKIIEKDGIKVGLLCLTHKEFGTLGLDSKLSDFGAAWINHPLVNKTILSSKKQCDYLIVLPHAGVEDLVAPLPEWRSRYKEFIDLGADAVIASHPHTPQGWEEYAGKMIFYSLGNFYFKSKSTGHQGNWYKSLLVCISIDNNGISCDVYNAEFNDRIISLAEKTTSNSYNSYLCNLLIDEKEYISYINENLLKLWPEYKLYLLRGLAAVNATTNLHVLSHAAYGVLKGADLPMMLNNFQCESHRWAIERMLNLQKK